MDEREARRQRLEKIRALGIDPYGQRFDGHESISDIRNRADEIKYVTEEGQSINLPKLDDNHD